MRRSRLSCERCRRDAVSATRRRQMLPHHPRGCSQERRPQGQGGCGAGPGPSALGGAAGTLLPSPGLFSNTEVSLCHCATHFTAGQPPNLHCELTRFAERSWVTKHWVPLWPSKLFKGPRFPPHLVPTLPAGQSLHCYSVVASCAALLSLHPKGSLLQSSSFRCYR